MTGAWGEARRRERPRPGCAPLTSPHAFCPRFLPRKVVTIAKSRSFRDRHGKVLLEGLRLIRDALRPGAAPRALFFSTAEHLRELPPAPLKGARLVRVRFEDIKCWSDVVAPQGMIGEMR